MKNKIYFSKRLMQTDKATLFTLKSQVIRGMKVRAYTELWVPNRAYKHDKLTRDLITVDDWFWNRLVFVYK